MEKVFCWEDPELRMQQLRREHDQPWAAIRYKSSLRQELPRLPCAEHCRKLTPRRRRGFGGGVATFAIMGSSLRASPTAKLLARPRNRWRSRHRWFSPAIALEFWVDVFSPTLRQHEAPAVN